MQESAQLYRQAKMGYPTDGFLCFYSLLSQKNIPSAALLPLTVYAILDRDKMRHTVSHTVIPEANAAIDTERLRDIYPVISATWIASWRIFGYARMGKNHSHSIVPGGFDVTS